MTTDSMPRPFSLPRSRLTKVKDAVLSLEGIVGRTIEEDRPLTQEEKREMAKNEALEAEPPWLRRSNRWPTAREYASSIAYPWVDAEALTHPMGKWRERVTTVLRLMTARGRQLRTLKALLLAEVSDIRWKHYELARVASEKAQARRMLDWWAEHHQMVERELIDDLRGVYPEMDEADLKGTVDSWSMRRRQRLLEVATRKMREAKR